MASSGSSFFGGYGSFFGAGDEESADARSSRGAEDMETGSVASEPPAKPPPTKPPAPVSAPGPSSSYFNF